MALLVYGGSVEVEEVKAPKFRLSEGERIITRDLRIKEPQDPPDMSGLDAALDEMFPANTLGGRFPTGANMFVRSAEIRECSKPIHIHSGVAVPKEWEARVTYGPSKFKTPAAGQPPDPTDPLTYLEMQEEIGGEEQTLPGSRLFWPGESKPIGDESVSSSLTIYTNDYLYTRHFYRPTTAFRTLASTLRGTVNAEDFADDHPLFPGVKKYQLLFAGTAVNASFNSDGSRKWSTTVRLSRKSAKEDSGTFGWNHMWDERNRSFRIAYRVRDTRPDGSAEPNPQESGNFTLYLTSPNDDFVNLFLV